MMQLFIGVALFFAVAVFLMTDNRHFAKTRPIFAYVGLFALAIVGVLWLLDLVLTYAPAIHASAPPH